MFIIIKSMHMPRYEPSKFLPLKSQTVRQTPLRQILVKPKEALLLAQLQFKGGLWLAVRLIPTFHFCTFFCVII